MNPEQIKKLLARVEKKMDTKLDKYEVDINLLSELVGALKEITVKMDELVAQKDQAQKQADEANAQMARILKESEEKEKNDFFDQVAKEGRVEPAEIEEFKALYDKNKDSVKKILLGRKENTDKTKILSSSFSGHNKLTSEEIAVLKDRGLDPTNEQHISWIRG